MVLLSAATLAPKLLTEIDDLLDSLEAGNRLATIGTYGVLHPTDPFLFGRPRLSFGKSSKYGLKPQWFHHPMAFKRSAKQREFEKGHDALPQPPAPFAEYDL